jgi:hypothetical protein
MVATACLVGARDARDERAEHVVLVEAHAVSVTGEDQEEVERALVGKQAREEAVVEEAIRNEGEATPDGADTVGEDRSAEGREGRVAHGPVLRRRRLGVFFFRERFSGRRPAPAIRFLPARWLWASFGKVKM